MTSKNTAFLFYPVDWRSDTQVQMASMQTRGVWFEMLCCMWDSPERGKLEGNHEQLARLLGCSIEELKSAITEIAVTKIADVTDGNGNVTIINRRMYREEKERKSTRLRVRKHRETLEKKGCNTNVTAPSSDTVTDTNSTPTISPLKKKFIPPTLEETKIFFAENGYSELAAKQAWNYYQDGNWKDSTGKPVLNWKQKFRAVWFKDENKVGYQKSIELYPKKVTRSERNNQAIKEFLNGNLKRQ